MKHVDGRHCTQLRFHLTNSRNGCVIREGRKSTWSGALSLSISALTWWSVLQGFHVIEKTAQGVLTTCFRGTSGLYSVSILNPTLIKVSLTEVTRCKCFQRTHLNFPCALYLWLHFVNRNTLYVACVHEKGRKKKHLNKRIMLHLDQQMSTYYKRVNLCLTKHHAMKTFWGVEVQRHACLTSALGGGGGGGGGECTASRPGRFTSGKEPAIPIGWEAVWAPETVEKNSQPLLGIELPRTPISSSP
jgi:hypothetical protein